MKNEGENARERAYIRTANLTRVRDAHSILAHITPATDPLNIPEEEYLRVMNTLQRWMDRLEGTRRK